MTLHLPGSEVFHETLMRATCEKFRADDFEKAGLLLPSGKALMAHGRVAGIEPAEVIEGSPFNLLTYGGGSAFWDLLIGAGNQNAFNNTNAYIGVGNSATAAAATQTDLQGASKNRQGMEATFPSHTDGTTVGSEDCDFKSQWGTGDGNFAWQEWALFNASTAGRMLQRKVESLGTKTSAAIWTLTITLSLA